MIQFYHHKEELNRHIESVHEGKETFKLNYCGTGFSLKGNLNSHIESFHAGKKLFKCNGCVTDFSLIRNMNTYIHSVHGLLKDQCISRKYLSKSMLLKNSCISSNIF